jgi:hypothetical protein
MQAVHSAWDWRCRSPVTGDGEFRPSGHAAWHSPQSVQSAETRRASTRPRAHSESSPPSGQRFRHQKRGCQCSSASTAPSRASGSQAQRKCCWSKVSTCSFRTEKTGSLAGRSAGALK